MKKAYPCIENFWNQVLYYREHGIDKLHTKIKEAKKKKIIDKKTGNSQSIEKFLIKSPNTTTSVNACKTEKQFVLDENIDFRDTLANLDTGKKKYTKKDYLDKFDFLD
jgi:predicted nucleic acid-binding protein